MSAINHLLALLSRQHDLLRKLTELAREERACLITSQLERLEAITTEQMGLLGQQSIVSKRITRALDVMGAEMQLSGSITLRAVSEHCADPSIATRLRHYARDITTMGEELQREGRVNWHLAQQALKYVDFTMKLIARAKEGPHTYMPTLTNENARPVQLLVDRSA